ncbi:MAG: PAS domain S-box protein [Chloroflexi bacterium]|nr:PAS domain S-box protein [Chloroflexota bacterium]
MTDLPLDKLIEASRSHLAQLRERLTAARDELPADVASTLDELAGQMDEIQAACKERIDRTDLFRTAVEGSAVAMALTGADAHLIYVNPAFCQMLGYDLAELIGRSVYDFTHPDDILFNQVALQSLSAPLAPAIGIEKRYLRKDGSVLWGYANSSRVTAADSSFLCYITQVQDITGRKAAEATIAAEREQFRTTLSSIGDAVISCDPQGLTTYLNPVAEELTGWTAAEAAGKPLETIFRIIDEQTHHPAVNPCRGVLQDGAVTGLANGAALVARDGSIIPIEDSAAPIKDASGQIQGVVIVFHDVSEKRKRENEITRLNRTLQALSHSSQAMIHARNEQDYLKEVCRIITEDCGHALVWIGYAEDDEYKSVRPVAFAGFEEGYLETLKITWADTERGRGPTGTSIRTGQVSMCRNMLTDPQFAPWRAEALKRGYASSIVLPLKGGDGVFGALTIYSRNPDPFSADEIQLLSELADDLAHGIRALRMRLAQTKAEAAIKASEERYHRLFAGMTEGFALHEIVCDEQGRPMDYRILEVNPAFERLTGLKRGDLVGKLHSEIPLLQNDNSQWIDIGGKVALTGEPVHFEHYSPSLKAYYDVFAYQPEPRQFAIILVNITDRKRTEEALLHQQARLEVQQRLIEQREQERLQIARDLHDGPVQVLTGAAFALQEMVLEDRQGQLTDATQTFKTNLHEAIAELRGFAHELRPPVLARFGLEKAIHSHLETFREKHPDLKVHFRAQQEGKLLPEHTRLALFRIYQEALNNIVKHSQAHNIWVELQKDLQEATLIIHDDGAGFEVPQDWLLLARQGHLGLVGMRERAEAVGGEMQIESWPGEGTTVRVNVPAAEEGG